ncbi:P-loop containing nucleoside triphosphate hydrolase protein [Xylariaceae sp. FL1272]|nr:P-loop containing nucleoside triphosphate hydrolase protein [Xylariaceae sp. FL1272]
MMGTEDTLSSEHPGKQCKIKAYHETIKDGLPVSKPIDNPFGEYEDRDADSVFALVVKRTFEPSQPKKISLTVNSPHILTAFKRVVPQQYPVASDFTKPLVLQTPFSMLVHYWHELEAYRNEESQPKSEQRQHLDLLFEFMEKELQSDRDIAMKMIYKGNIAFNNAWMIFKPGEVLYSEHNDHPWLLKCQKAVYEKHPDEGPYMEVHGEYTDHDGEVVGTAVVKCKLSQREVFPQDTSVPITGLRVYPRNYNTSHSSRLEVRLADRGRKFLELQEKVTMRYQGSAEWLKTPPLDYYDPSGCQYRGVWLPYTETGRVILDRKTYREEQKMNSVRVKSDKPVPATCPPYTTGYSLSRKDWVRLLIDNIEDPGWTPDPWGSLVLPDKEKVLLRSLVTSHQYAENPIDQPQQKGKGLVMLLHGTPGSGKTMTAEVAAEASKKALVATSVGELMRQSTMFSGSLAFERMLKKCLQYATIWRAIVLLDEADVFLEARTNNNADKNSFVAIFLKELEYFSGIVFLTTNRVNHFDKAMKSRIHLALGYTPPRPDVRKQIWRRYLGAVPEKETDIQIEKAIDLLAISELNGREIANAVNTARTMARYEQKVLDMGHLETVLDVWTTFDKSLQTDDSV